MNVLALCAGYAGIELGLKLAGEVCGFTPRTVCYVEREIFAVANLVAKMEQGFLDKAPVWSDLSTFDGSAWRGVVDCVIAGFPCQPWSCAGQRKGTSDERWLWPDIARLVREVEPEEVFLENVPGLLAGGLEHILGDLASLGYDAEWDVFSAGEIGASQSRKRIFILARSFGKHSNTRSNRTGRQARTDTCRSSKGTELGYASSTRTITTKQQRQGYGVKSSGENRKLAYSSSERSGKTGEYSQRSSKRSARPDETVDDSEVSRAQCNRQGLHGKPDGTDEGLVNSESIRNGQGCLRGGITTQKPFPTNPGSLLAHADKSGYKRNDAKGDRIARRFSAQHGELPFPPRPNETATWKEILAENPEVEPAVCGVVDGRTSRVDELRTLGNGVVPVVAAYAFITLANRIERITL